MSTPYSAKLYHRYLNIDWMNPGPCGLYSVETQPLPWTRPYSKVQTNQFCAVQDDELCSPKIINLKKSVQNCTENFSINIHVLGFRHVTSCLYWICKIQRRQICQFYRCKLQMLKSSQLKGSSFPDPLTRGSKPGARWGLCPQCPTQSKIFLKISWPLPIDVNMWM